MSKKKFIPKTKANKTKKVTLKNPPIQSETKLERVVPLLLQLINTLITAKGMQKGRRVVEINEKIKEVMDGEE